MEMKIPEEWTQTDWQQTCDFQLPLLDHSEVLDNGLKIPKIDMPVHVYMWNNYKLLQPFNLFFTLFQGTIQGRLFS